MVLEELLTARAKAKKELKQVAASGGAPSAPSDSAKVVYLVFIYCSHAHYIIRNVNKHEEINKQIDKQISTYLNR